MRQIRKKSLENLKKMNLPKDDTFRTEKQIQTIIDNASKEIDKLEQQKVKELTNQD